MDRLTKFEEIDSSPNTVNYFWWTDSGMRSTSRKLAHNALASGVLDGLLFCVNEVPTTVVITPLPTSRDNFAKDTEEAYKSFSERHPNLPSFTPVFDSLIDLEYIHSSEEEIEEALEVFCTIRNMNAFGVDDSYEFCGMVDV